MTYWVDLSRKHKVHPPGIVEWGTTPKDFFEKKIAMMWTTTGNLTNVARQREIPVRRRDAAGRQAARHADRRRQFLHLQEGDRARSRRRRSSSSAGSPRPERAAQWCIDTGYVAVRPDAFETAALKKYVADFPAGGGGARPAQFAVAELSTHENQRVTKALNDGLQAALTGTKTPEQAMKDAQAEAERILTQYR